MLAVFFLLIFLSLKSVFKHDCPFQKCRLLSSEKANDHNVALLYNDCSLRIQFSVRSSCCCFVIGVKMTPPGHEINVPPLIYFGTVSFTKQCSNSKRQKFNKYILKSANLSISIQHTYTELIETHIEITGVGHKFHLFHEVSLKRLLHGNTHKNFFLLHQPSFLFNLIFLDTLDVT